MLWKIWAHFKFKGCHMSQESCDGGNNTDVFSTKEDIDHQAYYQLSVPKNLWCVGEALIAAFISGKTSSVLRSMPVLESLNSECFMFHIMHGVWTGLSAELSWTESILSIMKQTTGQRRPRTDKNGTAFFSQKSGSCSARVPDVDELLLKDEGLSNVSDTCCCHQIQNKPFFLNLYIFSFNV